MARKTVPPPTLDQAIAWLRDHTFDVAPAAAGAFEVRKHGCIAVLTSGLTDLKEKAAVFNLRPHLLVNGKPAKILDRGFQKFLQIIGSDAHPVPATAAISVSEPAAPQDGIVL